MPKFIENVEIQDPTGSRTTITLDGEKGLITVGSLTTITLDGEKGLITVGKNGTNGKTIYYNADEKERIKIGSEDSLISVPDYFWKKSV